MTVQQFYDKIVNELSSAEEVELEAAFLDKSKESLDRIDLSLMHARLSHSNFWSIFTLPHP